MIHPHLGIWLGWIVCALHGGCGIYKKMVLPAVWDSAHHSQVSIFLGCRTVGLQRDRLWISAYSVVSSCLRYTLEEMSFLPWERKDMSFKKTKTVFISTSFICCGFWKHVSTASPKCPNYRADSVWPVRFFLDSGIWSHKTDCQSFI